MGDHKHRGQSHIPGIKELCKSYKNLVLKWGPRDKSSHKHNDDSNRSNTKEDDESSPSTSRSFFDQSTYNHEKKHPKDEHDGFFKRSTSSLLSRSGSRRSHTSTPSMQRSTSRRSKSATRRPITPTSLEIPHVSLSKMLSHGPRSAVTTPTREFGRTTSKWSTTHSMELGRSTSKRSTTPIVFSQSTTTRRKPLPVEKLLDCSLEELCFGAIKNITILKDVINDTGIIVQQEETLKINVSPGWRNGTKITFEGKGDEKPGYLPADIIFSIREKRHSLYKRVKDDLELGVEVPLGKALVGCTITMPLLGGERMTLRVNDVISPGFQKSIAGQGMPVLNHDGRRGELVLKFMVEFPKHLSDGQRIDIRAILEESFLE